MPILLRSLKNLSHRKGIGHHKVYVSHAIILITTEKIISPFDLLQAYHFRPQRPGQHCLYFGVGAMLEKTKNLDMSGHPQNF